MAQITDGSAVFEVKNKLNANTNIISTPIIKDINVPQANKMFTTSIEYTGSNSITDDKWRWYTLISSALGSDQTQLGIPVLYDKKRVIVRGQIGGVGNQLQTTFREIPYIDEVPMLSDNGNNTNKITVDRLEGTADRSKSLQSENVGTSNRPITANIPTLNNSSVRYFLSTSSMKEGKPMADGGILQFGWDNTAYDSQLFVPNNSNSEAHIQVRTQNTSPDWSNATAWRSVAWLDEVVTLKGNNIVTGTIQAKTQATTDSSDNVATTQFVKNAIAEALKAKGL